MWGTRFCAGGPNKQPIIVTLLFGSRSVSTNRQAGELSSNPFVFDGRGAYGGDDRGNRGVLPKRPFAASQEILSALPNGMPDRVLSSKKRSGRVGGDGKDEYLGVASPFPRLSGVSSSARVVEERRNEGGDHASGRIDRDRGLSTDARHGALRTPGRWGSTRFSLKREN